MATKKPNIGWLASKANMQTCYMHIKDWYVRFRTWQRTPMQYPLESQEVHHCVNCGHDFTGNYCPYCAQQAGVGRITWRSIWQGIMVLWGMESRSLLYSLVQLLGRPGYFIREYISGHRQVSYPPVSLLVIMGVVVNLIRWAFPSLAKEMVPATLGVELLDSAFLWMNEHIEWNMLLWSLMFVFPTWFMFRKAPAYPKHTLPEGFFIQVFMSIIGVLALLFSDRISMIISAFYRIEAYRQLFGYGWWGTLWRLTIVTICAFAFVLIVLIGIIIGDAVSDTI
ncbi:MAG: DUF3667 domain-containing protein [Paludibacteraceae bacterium]|nr:DUF3667 domain-containing protein [Paludibacteraceae bacterium]